MVVLLLLAVLVPGPGGPAQLVVHGRELPAHGGQQLGPRGRRLRRHHLRVHLPKNLQDHSTQDLGGGGGSGEREGGREEKIRRERERERERERVYRREREKCRERWRQGEVRRQK